MLAGEIKHHDEDGSKKPAKTANGGVEGAEEG